MGGTFSEPVVNIVGEGCVAFVFRSYDKLRVLHADAKVHEVVVSLVRDMNSNEDVITESKHGAVQFRLPGSPFSASCGKDSAFIGKYFTLRLLEELYVMGYDFLLSSDLSRAFDQGTLFFKQGLISGERTRKSFIAISPHGFDRIHLVKCTDAVIQTVREAVVSAWKPGIQTEGVSPADKMLYEIKVRGNPWSSDSPDEALASRKLLLSLLGQLALSGWKLHAAVNVRNGCGNCLFFVHEERHAMASEDFAVIAPGRFDRLRLIGFDSAALEAARLTVLRFHQRDPDDRYGSGCAEYKLKGYPFSCSAEEGIASRQLICRLLEALRDRGWEVLAGLDVATKKSFEKSLIVMNRCESARLKFACVAPGDIDRLYLINFPHQISQLLKQTITRYYLPGVVSQEARDASSVHEFVLQGPPWSHNSSFNLQARTMLMMIVKELGTYGWQVVASADVSSKYVHHDSGTDFPLDVQTLYFCFNGLPKGVSVPNSASVSFSELRVMDLEDL